jgi:hypothetical protein
MLDRIAQIHRTTLDTEVSECAEQQLAGRADEGFALPVLDIAGLFSDQHQPRPRRAFTEHRLDGIAI